MRGAYNPSRGWHRVERKPQWESTEEIAFGGLATTINAEGESRSLRAVPIGGMPKNSSHLGNRKFYAEFIDNRCRSHLGNFVIGTWSMRRPTNGLGYAISSC